CNAYLIVDGNHRILMDPGSTVHHFPQVKRRVEQIVPPESITHIVVHHQDADLCDSLPSWLELAPELTIVTTPRVRVLLPYFGFSPDVKWLDVSPEDSTTLDLAGGSLVFITSPFLHFPEAFVTYDEASGILFSSDIGAAIENDWKLVITDWESHWRTMIPFHVFYMASNKALNGFLKKLEPFPISAICPQHGSIIPEEHVDKAIENLAKLPCGLDLLYPASNIESVLAEIL
ncbi:MAG TPA: MBL fold metallo-hydrolase, partial [Acidobacteria bacterium]|nr:MBL fold metallo-hydrolase [Acidobacteriota bacterium]